MIYDEFTLSGNRIARDTLHRRCTMPRVAGIKESTGSAQWTREVVADNPRVPVFEGRNTCWTRWSESAGASPLWPTSTRNCAQPSSTRRPPTADRHATIEALVRQHDLDGPEWVRSLKAELVRRGVLRSARVLDHAEMAG